MAASKESSSKKRKPESVKKTASRRKTFRWIVLLVCVVVLAGFVFLATRQYTLNVVQKGDNELVLHKTHPLWPDKYMRLKWWKDLPRGEFGWCIFAPETEGGVERWHLVMRKDKQTIVEERAEWWTYELSEKPEL